MRFLLIILLGPSIFFQSYSQINGYEMIGFGCGFAGERSVAVNNFDVLLLDKNYNNIKSQLFSKSPANQFLAVVALESLVEKKLLELDSIYLNKIEKTKVSGVLVRVCSGCTYWDTVSLKELFSANKEHHQMYISAQYWMKNFF